MLPHLSRLELRDVYCSSGRLTSVQELIIEHKEYNVRYHHDAYIQLMLLQQSVNFINTVACFPLITRLESFAVNTPGGHFVAISRCCPHLRALHLDATLYLFELEAINRLPLEEVQ